MNLPPFCPSPAVTIICKKSFQPLIRYSKLYNLCYSKIWWRQSRMQSWLRLFRKHAFHRVKDHGRGVFQVSLGGQSLAFSTSPSARMGDFVYRRAKNHQKLCRWHRFDNNSTDKEVHGSFSDTGRDGFAAPGVQKLAHVTRPFARMGDFVYRRAYNHQK